MEHEDSGGYCSNALVIHVPDALAGLNDLSRELSPLPHKPVRARSGRIAWIEHAPFAVVEFNHHSVTRPAGVEQLRDQGFDAVAAGGIGGHDQTLRGIS